MFMSPGFTTCSFPIAWQLAQGKQQPGKNRTGDLNFMSCQTHLRLAELLCRLCEVQDVVHDLEGQA